MYVLVYHVSFLSPTISECLHTDVIDKDTQEIKQDEDQTVYKNLEDIAEDLPDNSPRFILLSYPFTKADGRLAVPYVLVSYMPSTCNSTSKMLYAAAKELMRNTAEVGSLLEIKSQEELVEEVPRMLGDEK